MNNYELELLDKAYLFVKELLKNDYTGHDIEHINRVLNISKEITNKVNCDKFIVELSIILHDIDDYKVVDNNNGELYNCIRFLKSNNIEQSKIDLICNIINNVSYSKNKDKIQNLSVEAMIVQDADRIDALGAIGIARTFQYGGKKNRKMYGDVNSTINHFDDKLLKIYDMLNLKESKEISEYRYKFLVEFYNQFKKEAGIK